MAAIGFTFLNTTGAPRLSKPASKRVRGHVTRTNFSNRRKRIAEAETRRSTITNLQLACDRSASRHDTWDSLAAALSLATARTDRCRSAQLLNEFWSVLLLGNRGTAADDAFWLEMLAAEPALLEATMSMAVRCWSSNQPCRLRAELHSHRATSMLIQRIGSQDAYTDGFLGTAFTMALNEYFLQNKEAWEVHINGIIQSVRGRRSAGMDALPSLFTDIVILDSVNSIFDVPRVYHPILVQEIAVGQSGIILALDAISRRVAQLRRTILLHRKDQLPPEDVELNIHQPWTQLYSDAQRLELDDNPYVCSAAKSIKLILAVLWPLHTNDDDCALLAEDLRISLASMSGRSCLYMDLSSCQLIIGAITAKRGSEARAWYVGRLQTALQAIEQRGWEKPFGILERAVASDEHLLGRLRTLRDEVSSP